MDIGMLWYDSDAKRSLEEKVRRAVEYYRVKYGVAPDQCYVHPSLITDDTPKIVAGVNLIGNKTVIKHHFWLGVKK